MAHLLVVAAHPDVSAAKIILEPSVNPFGGRAFVVADLLGQPGSSPPPPLCLLGQLLFARGRARVDIDDRNVAESVAVIFDLRGVVSAMDLLATPFDACEKASTQVNSLSMVRYQQANGDGTGPVRIYRPS